MRFLHAYLLAYVLLVATAVLTLWRAGVLSKLSSGAVLAAVLLAIGFAVLLEVTSRPRRPRTEETDSGRGSHEGPDR